MTPFHINFPDEHGILCSEIHCEAWHETIYSLAFVVVLSRALGLNHSTYLVVEGGEGGFGAFAHGDYNLLVGDGGDIAGGIDAWDACAAMGVDDDLSDAGFLQFIERLAVGAEAYLYEYSVQGQVVLGIGCAVLQAEGSYLFAIANDLQGLG